METYAGFSVSDLTGQHLIFFSFFTFQKSLCLSQQAIRLLFKKCKSHSLGSVLVGVIFSQVRWQIYSAGVRLQYSSRVQNFFP